MRPRIIIAPEVLAEAKRLYEQTNVPLQDIAELMGVSKTTVHHRARALHWRRRIIRSTSGLALAINEAVAPSAGAPAQAAARAPVVILDAAAAAQQRAAIAQRLMTVAEREMDAIERIISVLKPTDQLDAQHSARTLASVSRILHDIKLLTQPETEAPSNDPDPDPVPRDVDEFRRILAMRIRSFVESRSGGKRAVPGGAETELG